MLPPIENLVEELIEKEEIQKAILLTMMVFPGGESYRISPFRLMNIYCQTLVSYRDNEEKQAEKINWIKGELVILGGMLDLDENSNSDSSYLIWIDKYLHPNEKPIPKDKNRNGIFRKIYDQIVNFVRSLLKK